MEEVKEIVAEVPATTPTPPPTLSPITDEPLPWLFEVICLNTSQLITGYWWQICHIDATNYTSYTTLLYITAPTATSSGQLTIVTSTRLL